MGGQERERTRLNSNHKSTSFFLFFFFFLNDPPPPDSSPLPLPAALPISFVNEVAPAFEALKEKGLIGNWGITGTGLPRSIMDALRGTPKPAVVQAVTNLLDSHGG